MPATLQVQPRLGQTHAAASPPRHHATCDSAQRIANLRTEVSATQAKLERLRESLAARTKTLNRLLAEDAMNGTVATARARHE